MFLCPTFGVSWYKLVFRGTNWCLVVQIGVGVGEGLEIDSSKLLVLDFSFNFTQETLFKTR